MTADYPIFFDIRRYTLHDGSHPQTVRTTVFFKGCPLRCIWCPTPEGIRTGLEVVTIPDRCIGCLECVDGCPESALSMQAAEIVRDESRCSLHMNCVEICPSLAHEAVGWASSVDAMMKEIEQDQVFYDGPDGGVTFSGGEPLLQAAHLMELLKKCGAKNIHRTVETSGYIVTEVLLEAAPYIDCLVYGIKHVDNEHHRELTGVDNDLILHNLRRLNDTGATVRIRFPLVRSATDDPQHVHALGRFLADLDNIHDVDLLILHDQAAARYRANNSGDAEKESFMPPPETISNTVKILEHYGLNVRIER